MKADVAPPIRVTVVSRDSAFCQECRSIFAQNKRVELAVIEAGLSDAFEQLLVVENQLLLLDIDAQQAGDIDHLNRLKKRLGESLRAVVISDHFSPQLVRLLVQLQLSDLLLKPASAADLVRTCNRAWGGESTQNDTRVVSFLPAAGGVGNTSLALQTAFLMMEQAKGANTCVVDLNLQTGCCAEYLDLDPMFDISEVDSNPDRLDSQLLNLMLSHHDSGLAVLSSKSNPTELRMFQPELILRLLDLVSAHFDNVVIDMPKTWFPWTPHVLLGADDVFMTAEMTVPCMRNAQRLLGAITEKVGATVSPKVIVNRVEHNSKNSTLRIDDITEILGDQLAGTVSNNYLLVRTALDKGVPIHAVQDNANVVRDLRNIIGVKPSADAAKPGAKNIIRNMFTRRKAA